MPIRVALVVAALIIGMLSAQAGRLEEMAPLKGRVKIGTQGRLTKTALACPQPGIIGMVLAESDATRADAKAARMGCFDLSSGDQVVVEDGMGSMDPTPPSHICVTAGPNQKKCVWILNVGVKAN